MIFRVFSYVVSVGLVGSAKAFTPLSKTQIYHDNRHFALSATVAPTDTTGTGAIDDASFGRLTREHINELYSNNFVVIENFIDETLVQEMKEDVTTLRKNNKFKIARIGKDSKTNTLNTDIRVAETCFLGRSKLQDMPNSGRDLMYNILETLRDDLSGNPLLDTKSSSGELLRASPALDSSLSELLYAYYPKGGFYRRHVDAVSNSASVLRVYSLLLYLNSNWKEIDGGQLRIHLDSGGDYLPEGETERFIDINPKGGTLVLFKSDQVPHEVLDTEAERGAIVGWFNRPVSSTDINALASDDDKRRGAMLVAALGLVSYGTFLLFQ